MTCIIVYYFMYCIASTVRETLPLRLLNLPLREVSLEL